MIDDVAGQGVQPGHDVVDLAQLDREWLPHRLEPPDKFEPRRVRASASAASAVTKNLSAMTTSAAKISHPLLSVLVHLSESTVTDPWSTHQ
jgi:hypothetical protein